MGNIIIIFYFIYFILHYCLFIYFNQNKIFYFRFSTRFNR